MKPIENVELKDLYYLAVDNLIEKRREYAIEEMTKLLDKHTYLVLEVQNTEKKLNNQKIELDKLNGKLDLLRKGDWNVLPELEIKKENKQQENKENKE